MKEEMETPLFSFGIISDVQYADVEDGYDYAKIKRRYYRNSINLLKDAIKKWNNMSPKPSIAIQLGDLIDGRNNRHEGMTQSSWKKAIDALSAFEGDVYHTFGNHEYYNLKHKEIAELLPSMTLGGRRDTNQEEEKSNLHRLRYSFSPHEKYVFIVLDTYEISMLGYNEDDPEYIKAKEMLTSVNKAKDLNSTEGLTGKDIRYVKYNGALGPEQIKWLDRKLAHAEQSGQKVIVIGHIQLIETNGPNVVWDSEEVLDVLHRYKCVAAVICGHDHWGNYVIDDHGLHHVIMPGVIETPPDDQAYGTVHVYEDRLELVGVGSLVQTTTIPVTNQKCSAGEH